MTPNNAINVMDAAIPILACKDFFSLISIKKERGTIHILKVGTRRPQTNTCKPTPYNGAVLTS
jgi:hypothetical protein